MGDVGPSAEAERRFGDMPFSCSFCLLLSSFFSRFLEKTPKPQAAADCSTGFSLALEGNNQCVSGCMCVCKLKFKSHPDGLRKKRGSKEAKVSRKQYTSISKNLLF